MEKDVGSATVSSGGIHGSEAPVPTLDRQVATHAESGMPDYASAFGSLALTKTALGEIGSTLAMQSGITIAKSQGTLYGKTPEGDLLPAFTPVDQAFVESYSTQAKATLGLQANDLLNKSEEQIRQSYKLSPESIAQFRESTASGVQDILKHAPSTVKPQMENEYANQIQNSTHQLNMQMITQQKTDEKDKQEVYNSSQVKSSFDNTMLANTPQAQIQAEKNLSEFKTDLARQRSIGIIDRKQEKSLYDSAKLNYYSGKFTRDGLTERANKNLPEYLSKMHALMPDTLSPSEKITVGNNVLQYMQALHNQDLQDQQLTVSQLNNNLAAGTLNGSMLSQAESILEPTEFNNFMAKFWGHKGEQDKAQQQVSDLANNFTNLFSMAQATPKNKDAAFNALTYKSMQEDPDQDILNAQTKLMRSAGSEVPAYTKQLNAMLTSGGPDEAYRAMRSYNSINDFKPQNVISVSQEAKAIAAIMDDLHQLGGVPLPDALSMARDQVLIKTQKQQEAVEKKYNEYQRDNLATSDQIQSHAKSLLGAHFWSNVPDLPQVSNRINNAWKDWYIFTNGNKSAADKLTADALSRAYGQTGVNGSTQTVFMPIEKLAGVGGNALPIIHNDIIKNVSEQLLPTKEAYDKGKVDWFYRIPDNQLGKRGPIYVERVWRGSADNSGVVEKLRMQITASQNLQLTNSANSPYAGFYDVGLFDSNGFPTPFSQVSNGQTHSFAYRPNIKEIQDGYVKLRNSGLTAAENYKAHLNALIKPHVRTQ